MTTTNTTTISIIDIITKILIEHANKTHKKGIVQFLRKKFDEKPGERIKTTQGLGILQAINEIITHSSP